MKGLSSAPAVFIGPSSGTGWLHPGLASGVDKDVVFEEVLETGIIDRIDDAYRIKYHKYAPQYVDPLMVPEARAATIKLIPC